MWRHIFKGNVLLLLGAIFVTMFAVWSMLLMQSQLILLTYNVAYMNHTVANLEELFRRESQVNRELMLSYSNSKVAPEIKQWYTYSQLEVDKLNKMHQESPELIEHIRRNMLIPPPRNKSKSPPTDNSLGQSKRILQHFGNKTNGIFIECGANDGIFLSNTLYLETAYNWTGLLIEAEPNNFKNLSSQGRNSWLLPSCLSTLKRPSLVTMESSGAYAKIKGETTAREQNTVHCMPLLSILLALNQTIDYFSLDIEGHELDVLRTVPFDKIDVKTWSIEFSHIKEGAETLKQFMIAQGYELMPSTHDERWRQWAQEDYIFTKS